MAVQLTEGDLRKVFPRARDSYIEAILASEDFIEKHGLLENSLRWCHFCGQIGAETDGLRIVRENMSYSAGRILQIFGRRHSAKVGSAEARRLARRPYDLAERVYGIGNPSMARRLGNTEQGDGYNYRGWGPGQVTGKGQSVKYSEMLGVDIEANPDLLEDAALGLKAFVLEWDHRGLNTWADRNQVVAVSKGVNLGNPRHRATPNGLSHRKTWFAKSWNHWRYADDGLSYQPPKEIRSMVVRIGDEGQQVRLLQEKLKALGYNLGLVDADFGPATRRAVYAFQGDNELAVDGIVGPATWAALDAAEPIELGERANITAQQLASVGSKTIAHASDLKSRAKKLLATAVGTAFSGIAFPETIGSVPGWVSSLRSTASEFEMAYDYIVTPTGAMVVGAAALAGLGLMLWRAGQTSEDIRVADAQSGANMSK